MSLFQSLTSPYLGFLRIGDAVTNNNIAPSRVIACVSGEDYELTPVPPDMVTLIYEPPDSDLLFYRGFAPGKHVIMICYTIMIRIK